MSNWKQELYYKVKEYPEFVDQLTEPERKAVLDVAQEQLYEIKRLMADMVDKANMNYERSGSELVYDGDIQTAQRFYHTENEKVYQIIRLIQGESTHKATKRYDQEGNEGRWKPNEMPDEVWRFAKRHKDKTGNQIAKLMESQDKLPVWPQGSTHAGKDISGTKINPRTISRHLERHPEKWRNVPSQ